MTPARACAFTVVRRVFEHGAYADRAFQAEAAGLDRRERALAMRMAFGTVQRRATLDHVAARLVSRSLRDLEPAVLAAIRLGLFQLLYLDGVAPHAAVGESVELVKGASPGGAGLVNAVLRRAAREGDQLLADLHDDDPAAAAVMHSVPRWLAELWWSELGPAEAQALLRRVNEPAESALRVNLLTATVDQVAAALPVPSRPADSLPEGLVLEGPLDAFASPLWEQGAIMPQSRASMLVARVLAPEPGERVLDLCAAPGSKTTHMAALMEDRGQVVAVERHPGRARALERTCQRMGAACVRVQIADAARPRHEEFDRVLADPPCSGLGTLQSRPDLRWRVTPESMAGLIETQGRILAAAAAATAPGGTLVYSVCTISKGESEGVLGRFLCERPEFQADGPYLQLLPHRDGTDGFFIARLRRRGTRVPRHDTAAPSGPLI